MSAKVKGDCLSPGENEVHCLLAYIQMLNYLLPVILRCRKLAFLRHLNLRHVCRALWCFVSKAAILGNLFRVVYTALWLFPVTVYSIIFYHLRVACALCSVIFLIVVDISISVIRGQDGRRVASIIRIIYSYIYVRNLTIDVSHDGATFTAT